MSTFQGNNFNSKICYDVEDRGKISSTHHLCEDKKTHTQQKKKKKKKKKTKKKKKKQKNKKKKI